MDKELFSKYLDLIDSVTGLSSPEANHAQVRRAILSHSRTTGRNDQELLRKLLVDRKLQEDFLNDVLIGETYFFREEGQFRILQEHIFPALCSKREQLSLWSASCSTGEEAISLAVLLDDFLSPRESSDFAVTATDINSRALTRLNDGVYPYTVLRKDGSGYHDLLLRRYTAEKNAHTFTVDPGILQKIHPRRVNLFSDPMNLMPRQGDIIFFRNTLLYFKEDRRRILIDRLVSRLTPGGYLFLSSGEIPFVTHPELKIMEFGRHHVFMKQPSDGIRSPGAELSVSASAPVEPVDADTSGASQPTSRSYDPEEVLRLLNAGEVGEVGEVGSGNHTLHHRAAREISYFFEAVNRSRSEEAGKLLEIILSEFPLSALSQYCAGWYYYTAGRKKEALEELYKAIRIDEFFWPARFYYALLQAEENPEEASVEFKRCAGIIRTAQKKEKNRFAFLLSEFDDSYFLHMCERRIEKLSGGN